MCAIAVENRPERFQKVKRLKILQRFELQKNDSKSKRVGGKERGEEGEATRGDEKMGDKGKEGEHGGGRRRERRGEKERGRGRKEAVFLRYKKGFFSTVLLK